MQATRAVFASLAKNDAVSRSGSDEFHEAVEQVGDHFDRHRRRLAGAGFHVEPSAAVAAAGAAALRAEGVIDDDDTTVVLLTGSGLKA